MDEPTIEYYEKHAAVYADRTYSFENFDGLLDDVVQFETMLPAGSTVADLGAGGGRDARHFVGHGFTVLAVDATMALLRRCETAVGPSGGALIPVNADIRRLPFRSESINGIWACASLVHLRREDIGDTIEQFHSVLMRRGAIGISMKVGTHSERRSDGRLFTYASADELTGWLHSAGFRQIVVGGPARRDWLLATAVKP